MSTAPDTTPANPQPAGSLALPPCWIARRKAAREAWIERFRGYFGEPLRITEYRQGKITFGELHNSSLRHIDDMVNEAGRYEPEADPRDDWPEGYPVKSNTNLEPRRE